LIDLPIIYNVRLALSSLQCCVQIQNLRTLGSKDKIAKAVLIAIFSRSLCSKVQWKKRGKDLRIGIGHLINLVAVFGGYYLLSWLIFKYFSHFFIIFSCHQQSSGNA
jgi:hypothetical protein